MRITYNYKNYPQSKELTRKSLQLAKMTHPLCAMVWGMLPGLILVMLLQAPIAMVVMFIGLIAGPIMAPRIRKKKSAQLDAEYAKLLENMQK